LFLRDSGEFLSRVTASWQVVPPEEALLLWIVSIPCHKDVMSFGIGYDCKVTAKSMA
jgi:hypothetical protein